MAEAHGFAGHTYGDAGILSYRLANQQKGDQIGNLGSSRHTDQEPRFSIVGATAELYPPSKAVQPIPSSHLWHVGREQQRWLTKFHPEAAMGNFCFQEPLRDDMAKFKTAETSPSDGPLLALGTMQTVSGRQDGDKTVPFMASATGVSGELLRLTVADQTDWEWGDSEDVSLKLSVIDPLQNEREIIWATDGLPITQIKYVQGLSNQDYVRWLLVQKGTSTTILQPEHHPVPITEAQTMDDSTKRISASLVKPNPILKLYHTDTGGNAHSDVVFSPAAFGQAPVLALIDECGFWSIWSPVGTYRIGLNTVKVILRACGHIDTGPLEGFPAQHKHAAQKHGLLVVCEPSDAKLDPLETDTRTHPSGSVAPILLLWKADRLQALNMHSATLLSPFRKFWTPEENNNRILAVENCPTTESRVFVLTEKNIVWAEIRHDEDRPKILAVIPHVGDVFSMPKMTTCAVKDGTSMVFTFSTKTKQLSVYWFKAEDDGPVRWHRHVTSLPSPVGPSSSPTHVSQITVTPLHLNLSGSKCPSGLGAKYKKAGVEFFQVNLLSNNLRIRYGIYATVYAPGQEVVPPTKRLPRFMGPRWRKRRDHLLRRFEDTFVLPDGMTEKELDSALHRRSVEENELAEQRESEEKLPQPVRLNMERLSQSVGRSLAETQRGGPKGLPRDLFEAIQDLFDNIEPGSRAPLTTWYQLADAVGDDAELGDVSNGMETEIEKLFDASDENKGVPQIRHFSEKEPADALVGFAYLFRNYCSLWLGSPGSCLTDEVQQQRKVWIAEVARNMLFSCYGVLVQDVPVFGPQRLEAPQRTSREPPSSNMLTFSPRSSQLSQAASESTDVHDSALARLSLLAPSLSTEPTSSKSHSLLSYWPAERGHNPEHYVSTVAVASDDRFRDARERLQRKEARRKSHVDKFRRQSMMRQGTGRDPEDEVMGSSPGPTRVQVLSSQAGPSSSQTQAQSLPPLTMSQPVSGAFGARKKKSKPKRKSGFR